MNMVAGAKEPPIAVRLPRPVLDAVTAAAKQNGRSRNSEIVVRLAESLGLRGNRKDEKAAADSA